MKYDGGYVPRTAVLMAFAGTTTVALTLAVVGCGSPRDDPARPLPVVKVEPAKSMRFVERIAAVGTARATEQVTLSAPVTARVTRLNFDDGGYVRRGEVVAVLAQGQQLAQLSEVQARARQASQQLSRVQALKDRGFATKSSLDAQLALASQARAQAAGAHAEIGDRVIAAPFAGWVSLRTISVGAMVNAGIEIATISDLSAIKLDFPVPETLLGAIRPGQTIEAHAAAFPNRPFHGRIATINTIIDPNTRAVMVRARLDNADHLLKPGMLLGVTIETSPRTSLSVPELALVGEGDNRFVYTVGPDGTARRLRVRTGLRSQGRVEILQGLLPGQPIVAEGVVKLSEGMKVRLPGMRDGERARHPTP